MDLIVLKRNEEDNIIVFPLNNSFTILLILSLIVPIFVIYNVYK